MIAPRRRTLRHLFAGGVLLLGMLAGCASDGSDSSRESDPPARVPLLTKASRTVLDQAVVYPTGRTAQVSSATVRLDPGEETGWHRHDTPLYVQVLEGSVTVDYDAGVVKTYRAGSAFIEAIGTYHNGHNDGSVPVVILTVSIGAEGLENTVARP